MSSLLDIELTIHVLKKLFIVPAVVSVPKLGSFFEAIGCSGKGSRALVVLLLVFAMTA